MKAPLYIDFDRRKIMMTKQFAKLAKNVGSQEYELLQKAKNDNQGFLPEIKSIKKCPKKETYAGLTFKYMEKFIRHYETKEAAEKALAEFEEIKFISKCHTKGQRYATVKKWFLEKYPQIVDRWKEVKGEIDDEQAENEKKLDSKNNDTQAA